jgi:hypothetical protein
LGRKPAAKAKHKTKEDEFMEAALIIKKIRFLQARVLLRIDHTLLKIKKMLAGLF